MSHPLDDVANTPFGQRVTAQIDLAEKQMAEAASKREIDIRFTATKEMIENLERALTQRFDGLDITNAAAAKGVDERFKHLEQLFTLGQENAKRAVDKAEATQAAHNVAANEWRGTLNDFKATLVGRAEFDRFYSEFSAYRLEAARLASQMAGEKTAGKEAKDDWKSIAALIIAIAAAVVAYITRHA